MFETRVPLVLKDYLGNELYVGDEVVYVEDRYHSAELRKSTIKGETKTFIILERCKKSPSRIIKI